MNMFNNPAPLPVGYERAYMSDAEYQRRAAPALTAAYRHEQGVRGIIAEGAVDCHGGKVMAAVVFNQNRGGMKIRDNWGVDRARNVDPHAGKDNHSQLDSIFDDRHAGQLVDGRGDGGHYRQKGANVANVAQRKLIPSSGMLGADQGARWVVDRDQRLDYASDPAMLAQAAAVGAENTRLMEANKIHARRSVVPMGDFDLNPGGNKFNEQHARADDYGIARLRSDPVFPQPLSHQVADLLSDPDPRAQLAPSPTKAYAGKGTKSVIQFAGGQAELPYRGPHAGRRANSIAFDYEGGAAPPVPPNGSYLGHDQIGAPRVSYNPNAGKMTYSEPMADLLADNRDQKAADGQARHNLRRQQKPSLARAVPVVEDVVFNRQGPLTENQQPTYSVPNPYQEEVSGKRADYAHMPAVQTNVGTREFGGEAPPGYAHFVPPRPSIRGYSDHGDLLHYTENDQIAPHLRAVAPPRSLGPVEEAINGGDIAPNMYSEEPRGLPRRHPGPERLRRGRGVDGQGHDHQGRQLATTLVDEVIFGRANFQGKLSLAQNGANFSLDQRGEFGHR